MPRHEITTPDGRTLAVLEEGGGRTARSSSATTARPGPGGSYRAETESARAARAAPARLSPGPATAARRLDPGRSGGRRRRPTWRRSLDALGVERFATYGSSGGGPHALACAALLGDRCAAAATLAGVGEYGRPGPGLARRHGRGQPGRVLRPPGPAARRSPRTWTPRGTSLLSATCRRPRGGHAPPSQRRRRRRAGPAKWPSSSSAAYFYAGLWRPAQTGGSTTTSRS